MSSSFQPLRPCAVSEATDVTWLTSPPTVKRRPLCPHHDQFAFFGPCPTQRLLEAGVLQEVVGDIA
jgi:hypothetical protein